MEDNNKSNFENLDLAKYDFDLKMGIWKNLSEFKNLIKSQEKQQITTNHGYRIKILLNKI
jgi:hypothetical protein